MEIKSLSEFVRTTRAALVAAGFVRHERDGNVWFENVGQASACPGQAEACPALVFIHGANDHAGTWFAVAPALAQRYRVIIPDLAGHGESEPRTGPIPLSLVVSKLEALLANERDLTVAGNSLGGWVALLYTLRNRERVSRLVLESSGGLNRPLAVPLVARTREEALTILRAVHGPAYDAPEWVIESLLARATESPMLRLTELLEHDVEPRLGEIDVPTTLIVGADDGVVTRDYSDALRDRIPNATLRVIEGAAHIPHLQQPGRFLECLTSIS
ncbi:MAG TPA: alpha/beta hydrolase [Thermoanaerobaculia bacterium]